MKKRSKKLLLIWLRGVSPEQTKDIRSFFASFFAKKEDCLRSSANHAPSPDCPVHPAVHLAHYTDKPYSSLIAGRLFVCTTTMRGETYRIISVRKASRQEQRLWLS